MGSGVVQRSAGPWYCNKLILTGPLLLVNTSRDKFTLLLQHYYTIITYGNTMITIIITSLFRHYYVTIFFYVLLHNNKCIYHDILFQIPYYNSLRQASLFRATKQFMLIAERHEDTGPFYSWEIITCYFVSTTSLLGNYFGIIKFISIYYYI